MADPRVVHTDVTQAVATANVQQRLPEAGQLAVIAPPPVTVGGCTLPPPPVVVTVGPFQFNILDWQKAAKASKKEMVFRGTIDASVMQYLSNLYADVSKGAFQKTIAWDRLMVSQGNALAGKIKLPTLAQAATGNAKLELFMPTGGWATFSKEYKGWTSNHALNVGGNPTDFVRNVKADQYWIWRELVDGKAPVAKMDPPFGDSGHKWGLFVEWTDRQANGKDLVVVTLKQLPQSWLAKIEYEVARVISVGLEYLCKAVTWDKLQDVRNFATAFPSPTVQSSALAWQGVASACGMSLPAQATAAPTCVPQEPPGLAMSWWEKYKGWLIGGALAVVGVGGLVYYRSRSAP